MNFKESILQNPILNRRLSKSTSNRIVTRHRRVPSTFITETPDLRKASVFSDRTWEADSDIYRDSDDENDEIRDWLKCGQDMENLLRDLKPPSSPRRKESLARSEYAETDITDDRGHLGIDAVLKVLYQRECKKLGVCPVGAFLRAPNRSSLNLRNYSLGPKGAAALAVPLLLDSSVTSVDLQGNGIRADGFRSLAGSLLESNYITHINLSNNEIGHRGVSLVKKLLLTNFYVVHINLSDNQFTDMDASSFAQIIKDNKHLKELLLSRNDFGEYSGTVLGSAIASNDSLELIDLSWNHIRGKGAVALAHAVKENVGLKTLRLAFNGFGNEGGTAMGEALTVNRTLRELDLSNNRIMDKAVKELSEGFASNDNLEILKIGVNPFTQPSALVIIQAVRRNESGSLRYLDMKDISVTREFLSVVSEIKESRDFTVIHGLKSKIRLVPPDPPPILERSESHLPDMPPDTDKTVDTTEENTMAQVDGHSVKSDEDDGTNQVNIEEPDREESNHSEDQLDAMSRPNSESGNHDSFQNDDDKQQESSQEETEQNSPSSSRNSLHSSLNGEIEGDQEESKEISMNDGDEDEDKSSRTPDSYEPDDMSQDNTEIRGDETQSDVEGQIEVTNEDLSENSNDNSDT